MSENNIHSFLLSNLQSHISTEYIMTDGIMSITAENGAGKSVLVKALYCILTNNPRKREDLIRSGCGVGRLGVEMDNGDLILFTITTGGILTEVNGEVVDRLVGLNAAGLIYTKDLSMLLQVVSVEEKLPLVNTSARTNAEMFNVILNDDSLEELLDLTTERIEDITVVHSKLQELVQKYYYKTEGRSFLKTTKLRSTRERGAVLESKLASAIAYTRLLPKSFVKKIDVIERKDVLVKDYQLVEEFIVLQDRIEDVSKYFGVSDIPHFVVNVALDVIDRPKFSRFLNFVGLEQVKVIEKLDFDISVEAKFNKHLELESRHECISEYAKMARLCNGGC